MFNCSFFLSNYQFFHSAVWLPDSHKSGSIWINWPGYSFQREWEWWNKWRRTFPRERPPVIQSHGTWLRSSPPLSGSAVETQAGSAVQLKKEKRSIMELTFTWKTVRIAAGNVSKLVVGVSSSKLNLWGDNKQNVIKLQRHNKVTFTPPPTGGWSSVLPQLLGCCTLL